MTGRDNMFSFGEGDMTGTFRDGARYNSEATEKLSEVMARRARAFADDGASDIDPEDQKEFFLTNGLDENGYEPEGTIDDLPVDLPEGMFRSLMINMPDKPS